MNTTFIMDKVKEIVKCQVNNTAYWIWIDKLQGELTSANLFVISSKNDFITKIVSQQFDSQIKSALHEVLGYLPEVEYLLHLVDCEDNDD